MAFGKMRSSPGLSCWRSLHVRSTSGPFGPSGQPDPRVIQTSPRLGISFFLWLYALLSLLPPALETPVLLIAPAIRLNILAGAPFFSGEGEELEAAQLLAY